MRGLSGRRGVVVRGGAHVGVVARGRTERERDDTNGEEVADGRMDDHIKVIRPLWAACVCKVSWFGQHAFLPGV